MSDRRTLEELKLLLAASRVGEEGLYSRIFLEAGDAHKGGMPGKAIRKLERALYQGVLPKPKRDVSKGILGTGSINDYERAYPEFKEQRAALIEKEKKANKKEALLQKSTSRNESRKNPFVRHRRKLVSDQLKGLREDVSPGKGRLAAKYEILRLLGERPKHTNNALLDLVDFGVQDMNEYRGGDLIPDPGGTWPTEKEMNEYANKESLKARKNLESKLRKIKSTYTPYKLRRLSDADLNYILSSGIKDPEILSFFLEEKSKRVRDLYNRSQSRRTVLKKGLAQTVKPSLPKSVPGTGGAGEQVAKTFLRLLTRGRGL